MSNQIKVTVVAGHDRVGISYGHTIKSVSIDTLIKFMNEHPDLVSSGVTIPNVSMNLRGAPCIVDAVVVNQIENVRKGQTIASSQPMEVVATPPDTAVTSIV